MGPLNAGSTDVGVFTDVSDEMILCYQLSQVDSNTLEDKVIGIVSESEDIFPT